MKLAIIIFFALISVNLVAQDIKKFRAFSSELVGDDLNVIRKKQCDFLIVASESKFTVYDSITLKLDVAREGWTMYDGPRGKVIVYLCVDDLGNECTVAVTILDDQPKMIIAYEKQKLAVTYCMQKVD